MKTPPRRYPEIFVERNWLGTRRDVIRKITQTDPETFRVVLEHPVFGEVYEIFELDADGELCLKSIYTPEYQTREELDMVKDYYNNYILEGVDTYIEYFNPDVGYFLLSRNVGVYPTNQGD
jgi:hypothetical protein